MRLTFDEATEAFREEFATWLDANAPTEAETTERSGSSAYLPAWARAWQRKLFDAGWLVPGNPPEYGGRNASLLEQFVHQEELARRDIAPSFNPQALGIVAPSILAFGTEAQKARWAVPILRAEMTAALGMSEPNAGSDLAGLRTRAVRDGDDFVVNGQKVWTSGAHDADVLLTFVRTDPDAPKHKGISALLIPTETPGITRRPFGSVIGEHDLDFNEVFFDDVHVPAENLLGALNAGWQVANGSLGHERAMLWLDYSERLDRFLLEFSNRAAGTPLDTDPRVLDWYGSTAIDGQALKLLGYRALAKAQRGAASNEESILKLFGSEASQRASGRAVEELGPTALDHTVLSGSYSHLQVDAFNLSWFNRYLRSFAGTIAGGTSEIQRNIVAERVLGLPGDNQGDNRETTEEMNVAETVKVNPEPRMLIDGKLVEASAGKTFENINPATEEVLGQVADASKDDMGRAIAAARRAFDETDWSTNRAFRKQCLLQLQEALEAEKEELREQLILEVGCPRALTYGPQLEAPLADALRWPAEFIDRYAWEIELEDRPDPFRGDLQRRRIWKEPAGVVGAITPWNYPFEVAIVKLGQALATGNTVVLKPPPDTPWSATLIGRVIADRTDIPAGVVNVVTSSDHLVGEELTLSPQVDLISFTGSTGVGKRIMEKGAATMKRLFLELGGKSATIVLEDADFPSALMMGLAVCSHAGQGCAIQTRMLLPRSRYDEGVEILKQAMANVPYGDPQRPDVMMGPVISAKQRERVLGYIEKGVAEGATLALGGGRPKDLDKGWFVEPTLFVDVDNSMTIAQEEIFGPVLSVIPFDDEDDAVRIANDSQYGLGGGVASGSLERSLAVARRIRTGHVSVNGGNIYSPDLPFGGYKDSGVGRQNGTAGFDQYVETKSIAWPVG